MEEGGHKNTGEKMEREEGREAFKGGEKKIGKFSHWRSFCEAKNNLIICGFRTSVKNTPSVKQYWRDWQAVLFQGRVCGVGNWQVFLLVQFFVRLRIIFRVHPNIFKKCLRRRENTLKDVWDDFCFRASAKIPQIM